MLQAPFTKHIPSTVPKPVIVWAWDNMQIISNTSHHQTQSVQEASLSAGHFPSHHRTQYTWPGNLLKPELHKQFTQMAPKELHYMVEAPCNSARLKKMANVF